MTFDAERFILEIKLQKAIWDLSSNEYSNRDLKKQQGEETVVLFVGEGLTIEKKTLEVLLHRILDMNNNKYNINYNKALEYWAEVPPTVDGVLGGFGFISEVDVIGSKLFLESLFSLDDPPGCLMALDCGAGIGRITKNLLIPYFQAVDVVEPDEKFINCIKEFVGEESSKIVMFYQISLQEFQPDKKYDVIWNQWVLGYLTDADLVSYLNRCRDALSHNGVIVVKENVTSSGKVEKDDTDSSITRSLQQYIKIFKRANLKRIKQCKQTNFPNGIYPVYMFALVPSNIVNN